MSAPTASDPNTAASATYTSRPAGAYTDTPAGGQPTPAAVAAAPSAALPTSVDTPGLMGGFHINIPAPGTPGSSGRSLDPAVAAPGTTTTTTTTVQSPALMPSTMPTAESSQFPKPAPAGTNIHPTISTSTTPAPAAAPTAVHAIPSPHNSPHPARARTPQLPPAAAAATAASPVSAAAASRPSTRTAVPGNESGAVAAASPALAATSAVLMIVDVETGDALEDFDAPLAGDEEEEELEGEGNAPYGVEAEGGRGGRRRYMREGPSGARRWEAVYGDEPTSQPGRIEELYAMLKGKGHRHKQSRAQRRAEAPVQEEYVEEYAGGFGPEEQEEEQQQQQLAHHARSTRAMEPVVAAGESYPAATPTPGSMDEFWTLPRSQRIKWYARLPSGDDNAVKELSQPSSSTTPAPGTGTRVLPSGTPAAAPPAAAAQPRQRYPAPPSPPPPAPPVPRPSASAEQQQSAQIHQMQQQWQQQQQQQQQHEQPLFQPRDLTASVGGGPSGLSVAPVPPQETLPHPAATVQPAPPLPPGASTASTPVAAQPPAPSATAATSGAGPAPGRGAPTPPAATTLTGGTSAPQPASAPAVGLGVVTAALGHGRRASRASRLSREDSDDAEFEEFIRPRLHSGGLLPGAAAAAGQWRNRQAPAPSPELMEDNGWTSVSRRQYAGKSPSLQSYEPIPQAPPPRPSAAWRGFYRTKPPAPAQQPQQMEPAALRPDADVYETRDGGAVVALDLPGPAGADDVHVDIADDGRAVTIRGFVTVGG
ncbi:hypothetical protein HK405_006585 [Cladochytrium tenue]|nr:hypothetical protein HK405_006585 [Cladochytrium tenue]